MGVIPEKIEYKNCSRERATLFANLIVEKGVAKRVTFTEATEKSHLDRYGFVASNRKVSVVYDLKAKLLSVTASEEVASKLKSLFDATAEKSVKMETVEQKKSQKAVEPKKKNAPPAKKEEKKVKPPVNNQPKAKKAVEKPKALPKNTVEVKQQVEETGDDSGGLSLKKYTKERFDALLNKLKQEKKRYKLALPKVMDKGKPTEN